MTYKSIASDVARPFQITGGLRAGYDAEGATFYDLEAVYSAHHDWQGQTKTVQGVLVLPAQACYGAFISAGFTDVISASEPGFVLLGGINPLYDAHLTNHEARARIESLATFLADRLEQQRIYYQFLGVDSILERES